MPQPFHRALLAPALSQSLHRLEHIRASVSPERLSGPRLHAHVSLVEREATLRMDPGFGGVTSVWNGPTASEHLLCNRPWTRARSMESNCCWSEGASGAMVSYSTLDWRH